LWWPVELGPGELDGFPLDVEELLPGDDCSPSSVTVTVGVSAAASLGPPSTLIFGTLSSSPSGRWSVEVHRGQYGDPTA